MFHIEIPKRAKVCSMKGEPFSAGNEYYSAIVMTEEEGVVERHDFCAICWETQRIKMQRQALSTWKSTVPQSRDESIFHKNRDEQAIFLLKKALKGGTAEQEAEAFVLALYLARKRRLVLREELKVEKGKPISLYEDLESEEMLCVPRVPLAELQVEVLQTQIASKLER